MTLAATYYGANGWLLEFNALRVLVDPWLRGSLSFPPGSWLLKGVLPHERPAPGSLDLLLLTQGLADHSHPESLELLPRDLPVIGSASAARVVQSLGFQTVTRLRPGETISHQGLTVRATAGALVPMVENGYLLEHASGQLYLSPMAWIQPAPATPGCCDYADGGPGFTFVKGRSTPRNWCSVFSHHHAGQHLRWRCSTGGPQWNPSNERVRGATTDLPTSTRWLNPNPGERLVLKP